MYNIKTEKQNADKYDLEDVVSFVPTAEIVENKPQTTQTTISIKKQETTISHSTNKTHEYNYDAEEPSMEDLFAIENEDLFDFDDEDRK